MRTPVSGLGFVSPTRSAENACNRLRGKVIRKGTHPYGAGRGGPMDFQCPKCKSTDLKRSSLAYQEGLQGVSTRTRLAYLLF